MSILKMFQKSLQYCQRLNEYLNGNNISISHIPVTIKDYNNKWRQREKCTKINVIYHKIDIRLINWKTSVKNVDHYIRYTISATTECYQLICEYLSTFVFERINEENYL